MRSTDVDQMLPNITRMFLRLSKTKSMTFRRSKTVSNILIRCLVVSDKVNIFCVCVWIHNFSTKPTKSFNMLILSDSRTVVVFLTAMFWHIRQERTYFAGKVLNFYQRNLIQNPSWSHNNSQKPWNIKSNILFLSLLYFWCCLFYFQLQWMWITTDAVFAVQGGGNNHIW